MRLEAINLPLKLFLNLWYFLWWKVNFSCFFILTDLKYRPVHVLLFKKYYQFSTTFFLPLWPAKCGIYFLLDPQEQVNEKIVSLRWLSDRILLGVDKLRDITADSDDNVDQPVENLSVVMKSMCKPNCCNYYLTNYGEVLEGKVNEIVTNCNLIPVWRDDWSTRFNSVQWKYQSDYSFTTKSTHVPHNYKIFEMEFILCASPRH